MLRAQMHSNWVRAMQVHFLCISWKFHCLEPVLFGLINPKSIRMWSPFLQFRTQGTKNSMKKLKTHSKSLSTGYGFPLLQGYSTPPHNLSDHSDSENLWVFKDEIQPRTNPASGFKNLKCLQEPDRNMRETRERFPNKHVTYSVFPWRYTLSIVLEIHGGVGPAWHFLLHDC